ncbi:hypothetical protein K2173_019031 [Erythroxylum novogranatense]|uniref:RRM domain-containing protein n=1 Tax=Erythroxylum novogranatense TaxID=1862640 RepID=A0AAV8SSL5_9ROSI|nr:hypothetical protein K2173_019031 [Erythroxylum novogranatense]
MGANNINSVFYADSYHPIQAGSIDGTDIVPHDNAIYRAFLCSSAGLYDPSGDPKLSGDPYCTVFVARLSHLTTEETLHKAMSKYGRVKNLRLVRDIVTGASRGYAFVEYQSEKEMLRAYKDAHHSFIDDSEVIVDYSRQQLMPGWIPRRLGGGLGGKKESGQLRFGGRERPFRAPLRPIPYDDLKRLGIPPPPEGKYMSRFQVPPPPRRNSSSIDRDDSSHKESFMHKEERGSKSGSSKEYYSKRGSTDKEGSPIKRHSLEREDNHQKSRSKYRSEHSHRRMKSEDQYNRRSSLDKEKLYDNRSPVDRAQPVDRRSRNVEHSSHKRKSRNQEEGSRKRHRDRNSSGQHRRRSESQEYSSDY